MIPGFYQHTQKESCSNLTIPFADQKGPHIFSPKLLINEIKAGKVNLNSLQYQPVLG